MIEATDRILEGLENGRISRREATARLAGLLLAAAGAPRLALAAEGTPSTFEAKGLNHLALRVTDVARSRDFYQRHFGLRVMSEDLPGNCFLQTGDHFVALFRGSTAGMDHYCYTVDDYDPDAVATKLKAEGLSVRRAANRVYTEDPDGLEVQLAAPR